MDHSLGEDTGTFDVTFFVLPAGMVSVLSIVPDGVSLPFLKIILRTVMSAGNVLSFWTSTAI